MLSLTLMVVLAPGSARSETYPNRPIRLIVPAAAGGGLDALARIMSQRASEMLGQPIIIENKPGASFIIGMDAVAKAKPDGYTLLFVSSAGVTINPILFLNMPLDPMKDLVPVSITTSNPFVLLVSRSVPATTVAEFVAYLKKNPGKLNHASNSASTQLVSELFKMLAGVDYVDVNFRGGGPAVLSTEAGDTQLCFVDVASATAALSSERLRAMAITTSKRYPLRASIPTLAEGGVPGYSAEAWGVLMAPAGTPANVVKILHEAFKKALQEPDVVKRINAVGNVIVGADQDQAKATLAAEAEQWRRLVKERNVKFGQ
jgi:tripartite-type tricarboxylate transporter receptor subunit TctC